MKMKQFCSLVLGPISEINLPIDYDTKQLKGFGIVTYLMPEHAVKAFTELDGTILHGRMLHLLPGKSKDKPDLEGRIFISVLVKNQIQ